MFRASLILTPLGESGATKTAAAMRAANAPTAFYVVPAQVTNATKIAVEECERTTARAEFPARAPDESLRKNQGWSLPRQCALIFGGSFIVFACFVSLILFLMLLDGRVHDLSVGNAGENVRVARSLAASGTFADPFVTMRTGPTAHVAPVYPFLFSLVLRALGTGYAAVLVLWAWNVGLLALQMALLPLLSSRLGLGALPGLIAAGLGCICLHSEMDAGWECFLTGALLLLACLLTDDVALWQRWSGAVLLGVLWGILLLTNPVTLLLLAAWPVVKILTQPRSDRAALAARFALMLVAASFTVAPWIAWNYMRFGAFVFVRDNLGLELYTGNNPCAEPTLQQEIDSGCHAHTHPNPTAAIAAELAAQGEVRFNRAKLHRALQWISANRSQFMLLTARRVRQFWLPDLDNPWEKIPAWAVTVLALIGFCVTARKNRMYAWLIGSAWALFPLIYYVVPSEPRYSYPIYWTLLLAAGCALSPLRVLSPARLKWARKTAT
jgi:hypothetical protein